MPRILIVEEEREERERLAEVLDSAGHEVVEAAHFYAAMATARRERPGTVLLSLGNRPADAVRLGQDLLALDGTTTIVVSAQTVDRVLIDAADILQAAGIIRHGCPGERVRAVIERSLRIDTAKRRDESSQPAEEPECYSELPEARPTMHDGAQAASASRPSEAPITRRWD